MTFTMSNYVRLSPLLKAGQGPGRRKEARTTDELRTKSTSPPNLNTQPSELAGCSTAEGLRPARPDGLYVQRSQLRTVNCQDTMSAWTQQALPVWPLCGTRPRMDGKLAGGKWLTMKPHPGEDGAGPARLGSTRA